MHTHPQTQREQSKSRISNSMFKVMSIAHSEADTTIYKCSAWHVLVICFCSHTFTTQGDFLTTHKKTARHTHIILSTPKCRQHLFAHFCLKLLGYVKNTPFSPPQQNILERDTTQPLSLYAPKCRQHYFCSFFLFLEKLCGLCGEPKAH